ncbi:MAG: AI-2E family transporter [Hyphomicrobiaceae bacterium]
MTNHTSFNHLPRRDRSFPRASSGFETIVISTIFISALYFGKALLVPLALAIFLTFLLSPFVAKLVRWHIPKMIAVTIAALSAFAILAAVGLMLGQQARTFAEDLPRYQYILLEKITVLKQAVAPSWQLGRASETVQALRDEIAGKKTPPTANQPQSGTSKATPVTPEPPPPARVVIEEQKSALSQLAHTLEAILEPATTAGIAIIFVIILLLERQDVRDRAIRLMGVNDLERTTRAMDDAGNRLKRYFLAATAINTVFGIVVGLGLWWIGIPNPLLWGVIAMLMRFIPFVGVFLSAGLPILLAVTVDPGWSMLMWTLALFVISEILVSQVVETIVHGQSTGLSPLAIIIATAFWTLLWGPIGLLLAVPMTVMLVVLGRHVERFSFLDILFGSQPALSPADSFYQRILAGDPEEAADLAQTKLKDMTPDAFYDGVVMEALGRAAADLKAGNLDAPRLAEIGESLDEFIADIGELVLDDSKSAGDDTVLAAPTVAAKRKAPVICLSARTTIDHAAASILAQLLELRKIRAIVATPADIMRGEIDGIDLTQSGLICVSSFLVRDRSAQLKFMLRKVRRRIPAAEILGGFWQAVPSETAAAGLVDSNLGVDDSVATFSAAVDRCILKDHGSSLRSVDTDVQRSKPTGHQSTPAAA